MLDELEITSSFNVCKHVGTVMDVKEITTVLSNYQVSSQELSGIADKFAKSQYTDGIPIKKLLLATELAIEKSSTGQIKSHYFIKPSHD